MSLMGPVLAGLSAGALVAFARNSITAAGAIGEVAEQIGITTDALQVLQFGAVQSGLSIEELERGLAALTRTIADAEGGSAEAAERFSRFGIAFRDANGNMRASETILGDIADAMAQIESPTQRAALATAIFGDRLGQRFIPLLVGGREALDEFERQARSAGQVLDQQAAEAARKAADNIAALDRTFQTLARNMAVSIVPALNSAVEALNRLLFGATAADRALALAERVAVLNRQIVEAEAVAAGPRPGGTAGPAARRLAQMIAERDAALSEMDRLREAQPQPETFRQGGAGVAANGLPFPPPPRPDIPPRDLTTTRAGRDDALTRALQDRARIVQQALTPLEIYNARMERLQEIVARFRDTPEALSALQIEREKADALSDYTQAMEQFQRTTKNAENSLDRFAANAANVFGNIADASVRAMKGVEDAIIDAAQTGRLEWRGLVNSILADLARLVIQRTITGPLAGALSSGLSSLFSGGAPVPAVSGASLSPRAMGGPVFPGRAYRVGEFGPETFIPSGGGRIEPRGGGVTVNLSIGVGVAQTVQAEIRNLLPSLTQAIEASVADRSQRGGGFAAAVRGR
jgi:tetratricopeptide (TPR) repeat protein